MEMGKTTLEGGDILIIEGPLLCVSASGLERALLCGSGTPAQGKPARPHCDFLFFFLASVENYPFSSNILERPQELVTPPLSRQGRN